MAEGTSESQASPPSQSTGSSAGTSTASHHLKQKRARSQLSCTPCRQGKLKCNRQHDPACDQCIKRSRESACIYLPPPTKHKPPQNVKGRIRQLESLVVDLMNQNRNVQQQDDPLPRGGAGRRESEAGEQSTAPFSEPTPPSENDMSPESLEQSQTRRTGSVDDVDAATTPFGELRISKDEISYVGASHWGAILSSISELKRDLSDDDEEEEAGVGEGLAKSDPNYYAGHTIACEENPGAMPGSGGILGNAKNMTREQILAAIPEKRVADRLLSLWFNSPDPFKPIIHAPTFQEEYRRFWRNPKDTPTMWLGLFFAIVSLATSFSLRDVDPSTPQAKNTMEEVNKYHSIAASAACLADFTKPKQYTIECLIMYSAGLRSNNAFVNVWLMIGLVVRLALRMGYHRDASHYPAVSTFQGEMRRRVWSIISMIDVLMSFQLGLPSMVKNIQSDTQPPRNLLDRDFNVSTKVLPPSRGIDELTPSSYTRAKLGLIRVFADAAELSHSTETPSREEAVRLDRELEDARKRIPPLLQMPDNNDLVTDPAEQLMCRFNLDLLYLKTKMVLHRRYMLTPFSQLTPDEQARGVGTSRITCIDAALRVLLHHQTIYTASQSGGQLESVKWYMGSISTHDFLLAAMIICLELSSQMNQPGNYMPNCPHRNNMLAALEKSKRIWSDASGRKRKQVQFTGRDELAKGEHMFDETDKASRAMAVMLERVKEQLELAEANRVTSPPRTEVTMTKEMTVPVEDASTSMTKFWQDVGAPYVNFNRPADISFNGVVTNHDWGNDLPDMPNLFSPGQGVFVGGGPANGIANDPAIISNDLNFGRMPPPTSLSTSSNATSPEQQLQLQHQNSNNFSLINDMLGAGAGSSPLDWEMWDESMRGVSGPSIHNALDGMAYGNALVGGTGPASSTFTPNAWMASSWSAGLDGFGAPATEESERVGDAMDLGEWGLQGLEFEGV